MGNKISIVSLLNFLFWIPPPQKKNALRPTLEIIIFKNLWLLQTFDMKFSLKCKNRHFSMEENVWLIISQWKKTFKLWAMVHGREWNFWNTVIYIYVHVCMKSAKTWKIMISHDPMITHNEILSNYLTFQDFEKNIKIFWFLSDLFSQFPNCLTVLGLSYSVVILHQISVKVQGLITRWGAKC